MFKIQIFLISRDSEIPSAIAYRFIEDHKGLYWASRGGGKYISNIEDYHV